MQHHHIKAAFLLGLLSLATAACSTTPAASGDGVGTADKAATPQQPGAAVPGPNPTPNPFPGAG